MEVLAGGGLAGLGVKGWQDQGREGGGRALEPQEGGRWILQQHSHMVGFAINFECLCGSIKLPMVVYREHEMRKLVAKTG